MPTLQPAKKKNNSSLTEERFLQALTAAKDAPDSESIWDDLEDIAAETQNVERVAELYTSSLREGRLSLARRAAAFTEEWFGEDSPQCLEILNLLLDEGSSDAEWAFQRLSVFYAAREKWSELWTLYDRVLGRTTSLDRRVALLEEASRCAREVAGVPERAIQYLRELVQLLPSDHQVEASLERLLERQGRWVELIALWKRRMEDLPPGESHALRFQIAKVWLETLHNSTEALHELLPLIEGENANGASELLERIVADESAPEETRGRAVHLLKTRYDKEGRSNDVLRLVEAALVFEGEEERQLLHREAANRLVVEGRLVEAMEHFATLLKSHPDAPEPRERLRGLGRETGEYRLFSKALIAAADRAEDISLRSSLRAEAARIHSESLNDPDTAIDLHRQLLEESRAGISYRLDAARELDVLFERTGRSQERCEVLIRTAELEPEATRKRSVLGIAARLAESLGQRDRSLEIWNACLSINPADRDALDGALDVLSHEERWENAVEVLRKSLAAETSPAHRRQDLMRIAKLEAEQCGSPDRAVDTWGEIVREFGEDDQTIDAQCELLAAAKRWSELADLLARAAERGRLRVAKLKAQLGTVFSSELADRAHAAGAFRDALEADPLDETARQGMLSLLGRSVLPEGAVEALAEPLRRSERWSDLAELLDLRLEGRKEVSARVSILKETANIRREKLGDPVRAMGLLGRALKLSPHDEDLRAEFLRLAEETGQWSDAARAIEDIARDVQAHDAGKAASWYFDAGRIWEERLQDTDRSLLAYAASLESVPRLPTAQALIRVAIIGQRMSDAESVLRSTVDKVSVPQDYLHLLAEVQRTHPNRALIETLLRIADGRERNLDPMYEATSLALTVVQDPILSQKMLERLFALSSSMLLRSIEAEGQTKADHAAQWSAEHLARIYEEAQDHARASSLLLEGARLPINLEQSVMLRHKAAKLLAQELGERRRGIEVYRSILEDVPSDEEAMRALGVLYESEGRLAELIWLRRHQVQHASSVDERLRLRLELSGLFRRLEQQGGRTESLKTNLEECPGHASSIDALLDALSERGLYRELADLLEHQATLLAGTAPTRAAELWARAASISEKRLGDTDRALRDYADAGKLHTSEESLEALGRLHGERGDHVASAHFYERLFTVVEERSRSRVALLAARAHIAGGNAEASSRALERAYELDPSSKEIRDELARNYRALDNWGGLAKLLSATALRTEDRTEALELCREAAELYRERLQDPASAISVLERGLEVRPEDRRLRTMLAEGLAAAGRIGEARIVLESLIADFGRRRGPDRARLHCQLGEILRREGERERALEELELATKMDVENPTALRSLAELAHEAGHLERAERAYRTLLLMIRQRPNEALAVRSCELLYGLHWIAKEKGEESQAIELLESALESVTRSPEEAVHLKNMAVARGDATLALRALEISLEASGERAEERASLLVETARLLEEVLERPEEAFERWLEAVSENPASDTIHAATRKMASKLGACLRYIDVLRTLSERSRRKEDESLAAALLFRMGEAYEEDIGDLEAARDAYLRVDSEDPRRRAARRALIRIANVRGDRAEKIRLLTLVVEDEESTNAQKLDALYELAEIGLSDPSDRNRVTSWIEKAVEVESVPLRAAPLLRRLVVESEPYPTGMTGLYQRVVEKTADPMVKLDCLEYRALHPDATCREVREAAELAMASGSFERAERLFLRAVQLGEHGERDEGVLLWAFLALAERRDREGDIRGSIEWLRKAMDVSPLDGKRDLELRLGRIAAKPGGDLELAKEVFEQLLGVDPTDAEVWRPLLSVYRALGDEDRLRRLVQDTLEALLDPTRRNDVRMEWVGYLMESEERQYEAVETLKDVLSDEPDRKDACDLLTALYEKSGYSVELANLIEDQLHGAYANGDREAVFTLSLKLGRLLEKVRREDAISVYERALDFAPENREIVDALLGLMRPDDEPSLRAQALERLLAVETGPKATELTLTLVSDWEALGDKKGVQRVLELGTRVSPEDEGLEAKLEAWYRDQGEWKSLAEFLVRKASRRDPVSSVGLLEEAADLWRGRLGDLRQASGLLRKALEGTPRDVALRKKLVDWLRECGDLERAREELTQGLEFERTGTLARVELLVLRAELALASGLDDKATSDLEEAYESSPSTVYAKLCQALEQRMARAVRENDDAIQRCVTLELFRLHRENGNPELARGLLADWVQSRPEDRETLWKLYEIDHEARDWEQVLATTKKLVRIEEGEAQIKSALYLWEACETLGRFGDAEGAFEHVQGLQPEATQIRERLRMLYERNGAHRKLAELLVREAELADDDEKRFVLFRRAGELLLGPADDAVTAIAPLEKASRLNPKDDELSALLAEAYTLARRYVEAGQLLEAAIARHPKRRSPELSKLQYQMAKLARIAEDKTLEMQWLQTSLDTDKNNGEAAAELAELAMSLGDYDAALNALRAITLMKTEGPMSRAVAFLLQARISHERGEVRRAVLWARKALTEDANLAEASDFLRALGEV